MAAPKEGDKTQSFKSSEALWRLSYLGAGGLMVIGVFGASASQQRLVVASVGIMTASAAALAGILLGFIFAKYANFAIAGVILSRSPRRRSGPAYS